MVGSGVHFTNIGGEMDALMLDMRAPKTLSAGPLRRVATMQLSPGLSSIDSPVELVPPASNSPALSKVEFYYDPTRPGLY